MGSFPAQRWRIASARLRRQQAGLQMYGWRDGVERRKECDKEDSFTEKQHFFFLCRGSTSMYETG